MADTAQTLAERGQQYGHFEDQARIEQALKLAMREGRNWQSLAPFQKSALELIATKVARVLNGNPDYADNWHDIAGYAKLVDDILAGSTGEDQARR